MSDGRRELCTWSPLLPRIVILNVPTGSRRLREAERLVLGRAGSKARGHSAKELTCQRRFYPWVGKIALEKEVETHSSMFGWQVPEEAGRLQSTRLQRLRHDLATKQLHYLISFPP